MRDFYPTYHPTWNDYKTQQTPTKDVAANKVDAPKIFDGDGPSFSDVLDIVNPLQHIPVVSQIYRAITGDEIGAGARMAGGALFGGPAGLAMAAVNSGIDQASGKDIGEHIASLFIDEEAQVADAAPNNTGSEIETASYSSSNPFMSENVTELKPAGGWNQVVLSVSQLEQLQVADATPETLAPDTEFLANPLLEMQKTDVTNAMLSALEKYDALIKSRDQDLSQSFRQETSSQ